MGLLDTMSFEKKLELNYARGYKYGRGTVKISEDQFDDYFEFYCTGLTPEQRTEMTKQFWNGLDAGKNRN